MPTEAKLTNLTEKSWDALNAMRNVEGGVTLAELNEGLEEAVASANMTQLKRRQLISAEMTEFVCPTCNHKSKRNVYTLTEAGALYSEDAE